MRRAQPHVKRGLEILVRAIHNCTLLSLVAACGSVTSQSPDAGPARDATDATGTQARCDRTKPFGAPTLLPNINSSLDEISFSLTRDEKTAFVARYAGSGTGQRRTILSAQRASTGDAFSTPSTTVTSAINSTGDEWRVSSGADCLTLYVSRDSGLGGTPKFGSFVAVRADAGASFDAGTLITVDSTALTDTVTPTISGDGQTLYWSDLSFSLIYSAGRVDAGRFAGKRTVSMTAQEPVISGDELTMYYSLGGNDVLAATRTSKTDMFSNETTLASVSSPSSDTPVAVTADDCVLYISSNRPGGIGGYDIWEARRPQ